MKIFVDLYSYLFLTFTVIPAPLNLMITSVTENSVSLSWKKPSMFDEVIVDYQVRCKDMYIHMDTLTKAIIMYITIDTYCMSLSRVHP